jgi:hypothetical protein
MPGILPDIFDSYVPIQGGHADMTVAARHLSGAWDSPAPDAPAVTTLATELATKFDKAEHPRAAKGEHGGEFVKKGSGGTNEAGEPDHEAADPDANRPSRPDNRHPGAAPKPLAWTAPPPKKGKKGEGMRARPKGDKSQTKTGDRAEAAARSLGFRSILGGKRSHAAGEVKSKGSSIDTEYDHSGRAYELKMCQTTSTEYRLKAKKQEKDDKLKYARKNKLTAYTLVGVYNPDAGEIHFYAAKKPGLIGSEVNERDFDFVGKAAM